MEWVCLIVAGVSEITWAVAMKLSSGFTKIVPTLVTVVFYVVSAVFLSLALKKLPLGSAYAMWTGAGIVGTTLCGFLLFHEPVSAAKIACTLVIVLGIVGLKLAK